MYTYTVFDRQPDRQPDGSDVHVHCVCMCCVTGSLAAVMYTYIVFTCAV